jgi:ubiquinone/menaquinone biosynthesis C-methylase UbiE
VTTLACLTDQVRNPLFARIYTRMMESEDAEQVEHRREALSGLSGRVFELGAGTGSNFAHYPSTVTALSAAEPEPYLRERAIAAAAAAPVEVEVVDAVADALPFEDGSFDAAVACLVLCTVPNQARALAELRRVVRPGGELRFYEHVHADRQPLRAILEFADRTTLWPRLSGGCHATRETHKAIEGAGFTIERSRRFGYSPSRLMPSVPHIVGAARRT